MAETTGRMKNLVRLTTYSPGRSASAELGSLLTCILWDANEEGAIMKALVFGLGLQGRAALHYLASSNEFSGVIAADNDFARARAAARRFGNRKVKCIKVNANDHRSIKRLIAGGIDVVIDLLPVCFTEIMARLAVEAGVHLVNTFYSSKAIQKLDGKAVQKGITILPEFGFDPGIDLVMGAEAIRELDEVREFYSYGGGLPEPKACTNPLNYKVSWTFAGVLRSYKRDARVIKNGRITDIPAKETCAVRNIHTITVDKLGELEAIPNGDAVKYRDIFGLGRGLKEMGRFTLRWPGHCSFWKKMADLHFLDDEPIKVNSVPVVPRQFLCNLLEPQLQYSQNERDLALARVEVRGLKNGKRKRIIYELLDYRDLATGLMAMNRTVGYTAAIGAKLIVQGAIAKGGVLSPARDIDFALLHRELKKCGMQITRKELPG
jgi:saccharopine dehydrogenase-like NADP-dependent oxidoreductase